MAIYVGTNKGGNIADLAGNLNLENSTAGIDSNGLDAFVDKDAGVLLAHGEMFGYSETVAIAESWNTKGYKEIKLDNTSDEIVRINNFVDVHIDNQSEKDHSMINVFNVKRADINTGVDTDDVINLSVRTNGGSDSVNQIKINTGSGNDKINLSSEVAKASHTVFDIDAGEGNDFVNISGLVNARGAWLDREVSGGEGLDVLVFNDDKALSFDGFEVLHSGHYAGALTLDKNDVAKNASAEGVLVVAGFDVEFDFAASPAAPVDAAQAAYLDSLGFQASDFEVVTANIGGTEYSVLVEDIEPV